jgi:CheY-like chemotaxis protein
MAITSFKVLLADDDADDCLFFKEALKELPIESSLETVNDGEQLMNLLATVEDRLPDILFLDLNMPRKNGFECLAEIKSNEKLRSLKVVIYSTSFDHAVVNLLYEKGAHHYIRKPGEFSNVKKVIHEALTITSQLNRPELSKEHFVIHV